MVRAGAICAATNRATFGGIGVELLERGPYPTSTLASPVAIVQLGHGHPAGRLGRFVGAMRCCFASLRYVISGLRRRYVFLIS